MNVRVEHNGPVTTVILDRPHARNAVDGPTALALFEAFKAFVEAGPAIRGALRSIRLVPRRLEDERHGVALGERLQRDGEVDGVAAVLEDVEAGDQGQGRSVADPNRAYSKQTRFPPADTRER